MYDTALRYDKDAPWPVRRGGLVLKLYENSLSLAFLLLFLVSFFLHAAGGAREYNQSQAEHGSSERVTTSGVHLSEYAAGMNHRDTETQLVE